VGSGPSTSPLLTLDIPLGGVHAGESKTIIEINGWLTLMERRTALSSYQTSDKFRPVV